MPSAGIRSKMVELRNINKTFKIAKRNAGFREAYPIVREAKG